MPHCVLKEEDMAEGLCLPTPCYRQHLDQLHPVHQGLWHSHATEVPVHSLNLTNIVTSTVDV